MNDDYIPSLQVEPQQDILQLDRTLRRLCYSGRLTEAVRLLWSAGMQVLPGTYSLLLQECIFRKAYRKAKIVHSQMVVVGYVPNEYLKTKLIILYSKLGDIETANFLFDKLLNRSLVSWNAMIAGHVQKGDEFTALNRYYEMRYSGLTPDQYTFASVFRACAALATIEHGKRAHAVLLKIQIKENVVVSSALVDMYFKCSSLSDGHRAFDESLERNIVTWTALISGYGLNGRVMEVLESFHKMKIEGFRPNNVTFLAVLSACSHGGLVDQGWKYFHSMTRDYGIQPRGQHYATLIDLLGRAGRLKEAYELVLNSPCREHPVIWGALLGACRTHGDIDMLKVAARKYFELEPENSGKYVVLSNAYATFGMWDNVAEIRGAMRNWGMMKEPGYSRIEVKDEIHFFCKGDKLHRQSEEIYQIIKDTIRILKDADYVPDLSAD
ncbi:pentatricopeptide repeat-containing protein At4g16470 [Punica granatum]|uniref:Pentatricopeptide repeat-containing protein At4g16470 n=1 Tax=Punica granatum TaxID=22663 RepID=A0A6P8DDY2_PUNGR|nr:pentatricopeptide repeat-containing protein At4g16470 [Punica granatum]